MQATEASVIAQRGMGRRSAASGFRRRGGLALAVGDIGHYFFSWRMVLFENRFPLFEIMR